MGRPHLARTFETTVLFPWTRPRGRVQLVFVACGHVVETARRSRAVSVSASLIVRGVYLGEVRVVRTNTLLPAADDKYYRRRGVRQNASGMSAAMYDDRNRNPSRTAKRHWHPPHGRRARCIEHDDVLPAILVEIRDR